uniref:BED-type domain-containing protein n=1 Tax=Lactuca sativa TaxID=4236 RepID=A0A9R1W9D7_LACSA|nr:hypothetical protein LSAT_V11C200067590 [Lactuca sativa]
MTILFFSLYLSIRLPQLHSSFSLLILDRHLINSSSDFKTDLVRKYSVQDPNIRNNFTCTFCLKVTKGGADRMKQHLVGETIDYMKMKQEARDNIQMVSRIQDLDDDYYGDEEEDCIEIMGSSKLPPRKKPKQ